MRINGRVTLAAATVLGVAAGLAGGASVAAPVHSAAPGTELAGEPPLRVETAADSIEVHKHGNRVHLDLGAYLVAGAEDFVVHTTRSGYRSEPVTTIQDGAGTVVPARLDGFGPLTDFVRVTMRRDSTGKKVLDRTTDYCLNRTGVRSHPDAPDTAEWPWGCRANPFALGQLQGVTAGWGVPVRGGSVSGIELGRYTVKVAVTAAWRELIGIRAPAATRTVSVRVVRGDDCRGCRPEAERPRDRPLHPRSEEPRGPGAAPDPGTPLPDLRSLPAFGIELSENGNYLRFAANAWNAGPSSLVVDGFRDDTDADLMNAYQYFYGPKGKPRGHEEVGTMEWDARDGHTHWHFTDFARYRLVRLVHGEPVNVVRSTKEAFCLAATDAIDLTLPGAVFQPWNTDLHTACGGFSSLAVREVLPVGHGDTYYQYQPGQSFRVETVPDGIYYVEVMANPDGNLYESDYDNNAAYRRIKLHTRADGSRTVKVFAKGLVDYN